MAEMREVKSTGKRGPVSKKGIHHLEIHPAFGGGYRLEHHYDNAGLGSYKEPRTENIAADSAKAKHIDGLMGKDVAEPGGGNEHEAADMHMPKPHDDEKSEEGED